MTGKRRAETPGPDRVAVAAFVVVAVCVVVGAVSIAGWVAGAVGW